MEKATSEDLALPTHQISSYLISNLFFELDFEITEMEMHA